MQFDMPEVLQIKDPRKTKMDIDGSAAVFVEVFGRLEVARIPEKFFFEQCILWVNTYFYVTHGAQLYVQHIF